MTMANGAETHILGVGQVKLKLTFEKVLTLHDVQHVSKVRRNLISGSLLVQQGFRLVFESNKVILSLRVLFIEKDYCSDMGSGTPSFYCCSDDGGRSAEPPKGPTCFFFYF